MMLIDPWLIHSARAVQILMFVILLLCALKIARRGFRGGRYIAFAALLAVMAKSIRLIAVLTVHLNTSLQWQEFRSLIWYGLDALWLPVLVYGVMLLTLQIVRSRQVVQTKS